MPNGRRKLSSIFASSILAAASALTVATPAPAQYGPGPISDPYCCNVYGCGFGTTYGPGYGYACCYNDGWGWYSAHVWGYDRCYLAPPYESSKNAANGASKALSEPAAK